MKTWSKALVLLLPLSLLWLVSGCPRDLENSGGGSPGYVIVVPPDPGGGYTVDITWPLSGAGQAVNYPGVTAFLADITISDVTVNPAGTIVTFKINSNSGLDIGMLWLRIKSVAQAALVSEPTVDGNGQGQLIFVIGPLEVGGSRTVSLTFSHAPNQEFSFSFDLLEVRPRVAFGTDRALPGNQNRQEINTIDPDTSEIFAVTKNSPSINTKPVWSPGGEWIAYEGLTPTSCVGSNPSPPVIYLVHPDGSTGGYGGRISQGLFNAQNATFNPTGELLAYSGRLLCENDISDISIDIYLYDIKTQTQTMWFSGDEPPSSIDFYRGQVYQPEWSPDGNYVIMSAQTTNGTIRWFYAPVDPLTGATIPVIDPATSLPKPLPIFFMGNGKEQVMADGKLHNFKVHELAWAPDSRHVAVRCADYIKVGTTWTSKGGVAIFDFQDILNTPLASLPIIPEFQWVANSASGVVNYPGFNREGTQVWFDSTSGTTSVDLHYVTLNGYAPPAPLSRTVFLNDAFNYRTPALWPPARAPYFPLMP